MVDRLIYCAVAALAITGFTHAQDTTEPAPASEPTVTEASAAQPEDAPDDAKDTESKRLDYDKYEKPTVPLPYVDVMGEGDANVILIPDPQFDERYWTPFMERNADKFRSHAVVLPGVSGTEAYPIYYFNEPHRLGDGPAVRNAENAIVDYVVENGLENVYVVGDGIGGKMAFDLIVDHPEIFKGGISSNGQPCHILACLTIGVAHQARADCAMGRILPGFIARDNAVWAQRNAMSVTSSIEDPERGLELSEVAAIQSKDIYATYYLESIVRDVTLELSTSETPMYFLVGVSKKGLPPKRTLQWWRDRNFYSIYGAKTAKIVYFENAYGQKFLAENHPEAFDAAVQALIAGEEPKGIPASGPDEDVAFNTDPGARWRAQNAGLRQDPAERRQVVGQSADDRGSTPAPSREVPGRDPRRDAPSRGR